MRIPRLLALLLLLLGAAALAQTNAQPAAGAKLPLVTAGAVLRWAPDGDEIFFELPAESWIRLSIYSPEIDFAQSGDERYDTAPLEAGFVLSSGSAELARHTFSLAPSSWLTLYEGPARAGRHLLRSEVSGNGKNVYLLRLETEWPDVELQGTSVTVNASSGSWQGALGFEIGDFRSCQLELYDGDGPGELEARLIQPGGYELPLEISADLDTVRQHLPRLIGVYTVEVRLPDDRSQQTNAVRFRVVCGGEAQRVTLVPPAQLTAPEPGPIVVEVIDSDGEPVDIGFDISGRFERRAVLRDDPDYRLIDRRIDGGEASGERGALFGMGGGRVVFVLERRPVPLPRPGIRVAVREAIPLPRPEIAVEVAERAQIELPRVTVRVAARRILTLPRATVRVLPPPAAPTADAPPGPEAALRLRREITHPAALDCERIRITLIVENPGPDAAAYTLRERIPDGLTLIGSDPEARPTAGELVWRDTLEPGQLRSYRYQVQQTEAASDRSLLRGALLPDGAEPVVSEGAIERLSLTARLEPVGPEPLYAGEERILRLVVDNPLTRPLRVVLDSRATPLLTILGGPSSLEIPAGGSAEAELSVRGEEAGAALARVALLGCAGGPAVGTPATARLQIAAAPTLPQPQQLTTVLIDLAAFNLPILDGLVLVEQLPEGARYVAGSSAFNGEPLPDPRPSAGALVFELPGRAVGQLSFTVLHESPLIFDESHSSLIALTPEPELLLGRPEALALLETAETAPLQLPARARVGAVILEPAPGLVLRTRDRVTVATDTPLGAEVALLVNGEAVSDETVGKRVLDPNLGRQTFEYVGVPLAAGPNELRLESIGPDGETQIDVVRVYFAGAAASFDATPLTPLAADSSEPLQIDLAVFDAWGNITADGLLTVEVLGALPHLEDAAPERVGYQLRLIDGHALLALEPVSEPGDVTIRVLLGEEFESTVLGIGSDLRPWIVSGVASAGARYHPGSGELEFGLGAGFFARGRIFDDYLLTVAGNYPLSPLGPRDSNPFQAFPTSGSSGDRSFDAVSRHGFYARLERDLSYLQYGDFVTGLDGVFLDPNRGYTGLSGEYRSDILVLRGYGAYARGDDQVTVNLASDGTSARFLPDAPIEPGSLRVTVVKLDALGNPIPEDDNDPRTRPLEPLVDFRVDEEVGLLVLFRPLPQFDSQGRPYVLRVSYSLPDGSAAPRFAQFGAQLLVDLDPVTLRAGIAQETNGAAAFTRVIAAGISADLGGVQADVEVAHGSDQHSGGLAVSTRLRYQQGPVAAEARWQHLGSGYRSAEVASDQGAGHVVTGRVVVALGDRLGLAVGADVTESTTDGSLSYRADALANYHGSGFDGQFGVDVDNGAWRALLGGNLYDIGVRGSRIGVIHRQSLGAASSVTDFSVSLPLIAQLNLTLTDQLIWGHSNALFLGFEAGFDNNRVLSGICSTLGCLQLDPTVPLGTTTVIAQYEIANGFSDRAGRIRLGVDTSLPLGERFGVTASIEQNLDLLDAGNNSTVIGVGASYQEERFDASARYELRLASDGAKHVATAGTTFAVSERLFGSAGFTYVRESERSGFAVDLTAAFRGDRLDLLANNRAEFGALARGEDNIWGDNRLGWTISDRADLRFGYAYRWLLAESYLDIVSVGAGVHAWQGGTLLAHGRLFHDWSSGDHALGASLEASQRFGCGVYGVGGYNLGGLERDYGAVYGGPGIFVRLDVVFDEQWRCGGEAERPRLYDPPPAQGNGE